MRICIIGQGFPVTSVDVSMLRDKYGASIRWTPGLDVVRDIGVGPFSFIAIIVKGVDFPHFDVRAVVDRWRSKKFLILNDSEQKFFSRFPTTKRSKYIDNFEDNKSYQDHISEFIDDFSQNQSNRRAIDLDGLAQRLDDIAMSVEALRLNSVGHIVDELRTVGKKLRDRGGAHDQINTISDIQVRDQVRRAIESLSDLFDIIDNRKLASIIVAGAVSALVGYVGWSAVVCNALCLASWHGKEVFIEALKKLPPARKN